MMTKLEGIRWRRRGVVCDLRPLNNGYWVLLYDDEEVGQIESSHSSIEEGNRVLDKMGKPK